MEEEAFGHIAVSSSILAATTNRGKCHVLVHADHTRVVFPLASKSVKAITTSGDTVAILSYDRSREDGMQVQVTIWTWRSKKLIQCRAKLQGPPIGRNLRHNIKIMIGTNQDYLVLFQRCDSLRSFYFTRFNLDGQFHSQGSLEGPDTASFSRHSESLIPSDVGGYSTIWSYSHEQKVRETEDYCAELVLVQYDPQQNQLRLKANCTRWLYPMENTKLSIWKDVIYYRREWYLGLEIRNLSTSHVNRAATMDEDFELSEMRASREIFGDENFVVNLCDKGFLAWSFNKDTKFKREDEKYAQNRQKKIQERRQLHQKCDAMKLERILRSEEFDLNITGSVGNYRAMQERENQ